MSEKFDRKKADEICNDLLHYCDAVDHLEAAHVLAAALDHIDALERKLSAYVLIFKQVDEALDGDLAEAMAEAINDHPKEV